MADAKLARGSFSVAELRSALEKIVRTLPASRRGPSIRACLAQQLLSLAAAKKVDNLAELSDIALREVGLKCLNCKGCEGIAPHGADKLHKRLAEEI